MQRKSLGMIETWGHVPAVEAADAGCKAANVELAGYGEVRAGLVTVLFSGDVAAVKSAVAAASAAAGRVGKVVSIHIIPRPDRQIEGILPYFPPPPPPQGGPIGEPPVEPPSDLNVEPSPPHEEEGEEAVQETGGEEAPPKPAGEGSGEKPEELESPLQAPQGGKARKGGKKKQI